MRNSFFKYQKQYWLLVFAFCSMVLRGQSPGGVTGSAIWLKANAGVTTGATFTWADQSGNGRNGTQTTLANQPTLTATSINYNPAITFDGATDRLNLANLTGLPTGTATVEAFAVARNLNTAGSWMHIISYGGSAGNTFFTLGKNTLNANAVCAFNGSDAISTALEYANGVPALTNGKYNGTQGLIFSSGVQRGTIAFTAAKATTTGRIGCDPLDASFWNGDIAEAIIFPGNLTAANVLKVNSYLALKYGITLDQTTATNYVASDWNGTTGTVYWDGTTNSGNKNNIAGIGRDDISALNQKQSKSVNTASSGDLVTMGLGTIATNNASNTNTFSADKSFLVWGDNAGANAWQTTEAPSVLRKRLTREWRVQETGTVGNVVVRVQDDGAVSGGELPTETNTVYLLVDADGDFSSGATEYAMTLTGTNWEATVDFTTGQYFTFATQVLPNPGGITGATLWLKANAGTSTTTNNTALTTWTNQTGGTNATGGVAPLYMNNTTDNINFNPVVKFDGTSQYLGIASNLSLTSTAGTFLTVLNKQNIGASNVSIIGSQAATNGVAQFFLSTATDYRPSLDGWGGAFNGMYEVQSSTNILAGRSYMLTAQRTSGTGGLFGINGTTNTQTSTNAGAWVSANKYLGASFNGSIISQFYQGLLPEVIVYNTALTTAQLQNVQSYLGIKYGNTLSHNYYASDWNGSTGTTFWSTTTNSGYNNNIAGISRDDASDLNQKQSKSVNTGLQVAIGNGNTISTNNASNASTFSADKSALIWGDNAGSVAAWTLTGAPTSRQIVARTWKVQETGTVGSVKVQVPDNTASGLPAEVTTVYLLVDADGNFAAGATEVAMTLNGSNWEANVDFTSGQFFTFATQVPPAPGGVVSNNVLWLKANSGVTTSGSNVTQWIDASTNAATVPAFSNPVLYTGNHNFNPAITFNGTTSYFDAPDGYANFTGGLSAFVIARPTAVSEWGRFFDFGNGANNNNFNLRRVFTTNDYGYESINGATSGTVAAVGQIVNDLSSLYSVVHAGTTATLYKNGTNLTSGTVQTLVNVTRTLNYIGRSNWAGDAYYQGDMAEIILYNSNLSTTAQNQVESYLAVKYGITKSGNYIASDGTTTIWNSGGGYDNNIAGIARDDASALSQKQSKSVNTGLQVVMGNGNTIASDNASNTNTFSADKSALVWGDNAGAVAAWTTTGAPPSRQIVARKWKVQETGTVGYVKVQVPDNSGANGLPAETNAVYILVDADGNFASGATEVAMTLNGTNWEAPVDFTNGQFFTFATQENSPVNLNLAMTADKTTVSSGQNITYTLTLTNSGTNTATNVQVKDKLPAGVNFVSATPSSGTYNATTGIWTLPSVAGSAAPTLTIVVTAQ